MAGRIRFISIILIFSGLVLLTRLYFIQIVHGEAFSNDAKRQNINENTVLYDRGTIYFEDKDGIPVEAAISRSGFTVAINPQIVKDPEEMYEKLSPILSLDRSDFISKATKKDDSYEEIAKHINSETIEKIKNLNYYGVSIASDRWRFYPGGKMAANVIGFVAYNENDLSGRYGLERSYEDNLKKDPSRAYTNFFAEFFYNVKDSFDGGLKSEGDIVTSIEPSVQNFLEEEIENVREKWQSKEAGGIVIDPKTGQIIAMAWSPSFNLNNFKEGDTNLFSNKMVEGVYEMGSIVKPLTVAMGLDLDLITAQSTYYDAGYLVLNSKRISNYDGRGRGTVDMQEVLNQSLNTGAAFVALKIGKSKFLEYMEDFGLGTESGIDLPNEGRGLLRNLENGQDIEVATASYGQGVAFTPIATVRALSVLANGGNLITPHLVKRIEMSNGLSKDISLGVGKQVIKKETSEEITRMLVNVVDKALRGGNAKIPGFSVAAKTGTAQMTEEGRAGYADGKYLHSFFGYFPAYNPKFLVFLFHIYPKNVRYASETLTDPFLETTKFLINYYQIPPDRPEDVS